MKRNKLIIFSLIFCLVSSFVLTSCEEQQPVVSNEVTISTSNIVFETIGEEQEVIIKKGDKKIEAGISWFSNDTSVAQVINGIVKSIGAGETKVIATYGEERFEINVKCGGIKISLSSDEISIKGIGKTERLYLMDGVKKATSGVIFESLNNNVATVSNDGLITSVATGTAVIKVTYKNKEYRCIVSVKSEFSVTITNPNIIYKRFNTTSDYDRFKIIELPNKTNFKITYDLKKEMETDLNEVIFSSSNENILIIDNLGNVSIKDEGIAVITVTTVQKKEKDVPEGMSIVKKEVPASDAVLVLIGHDNTTKALQSMFGSLHPMDKGFCFYGEYHWKGFEENIQGEDSDPNTLWTKDKLIDYTGGLQLKLFRNGTFEEHGLDRLPRAGFKENVDMSLPENTVKEAKEKYGNAFRYPARMFYQEGVIKSYGNKVYLIMTEANSTIPLDRKIRCIGEYDLSEISNYKPFEFMNDLYAGIKYNMQKQIIGIGFNKAKVELNTSNQIDVVSLVNEGNIITNGVTFDVLDKEIAVVDNKGNVTGLKTGTTTLVATYKNTKYEIVVNVTI